MKTLIVKESKKARNKKILIATIIIVFVAICVVKLKNLEILIFGPICIVLFLTIIFKILKNYNKEKILLDVREDGIEYFCDKENSNKFVKWDYVYNAGVSGKGVHEKLVIMIGDIPYEYAGESAGVEIVSINTKFGDVNNIDAANIILAKLIELERMEFVVTGEKIK